ncbi:MAG: O-antigen ligase family protein [Anaerolineae bacterium]|nr:O-antigen ligase family protein [Anaerolineae bacterium]
MAETQSTQTQTQQRAPLPRLLLLAFVLYLTFIGGSTYTEANLILHILHQVIVTAVLGLWLCRLWRDGRGLPATPFDGPLLAYGAALLASSLAGGFPRVSLEQCWAQLVHVLLFYLLVDVVRAGRQRWLFEALFIGAAVAVMLSAVEFASWYFGISTLLSGFTQGWPQVGAGLFPPYLYRLSLAMTNANFVANYAALLIPAALAWALTARKRDLRQGAWLLLGGLVVMILLAQSRGGWMSAGAALGVMAMFALGRRFAQSGRALPRLSPPVWAALALVAVIVIAAGGYLFLQLFVGRGAGDAGRLDMWRSALEMVRDHPVLGVGPYRYGEMLRAYRDPALVSLLDKLVAAHNLYLQAAAELGAAGLAVLVWLVAAGVWAWQQHWRAADARHRLRLEACLAAFVGFGVQGVVDVFTVTPMVLPLLVYAGYVTGGAAFVEAPPTASRPTRRRMAALAGTLLAVYAAGFVPVDWGMWHLRQSTDRLGSGDPEGALQAAETAAAIDPALDLYQVQRAYVLGRLAAEKPDLYLDLAIAAHEEVLALRPSFDLGYANLGALLAQRGDFEAAAGALARAVELNPKLDTYRLLLGSYYQQMGDTARAQEMYVEALLANPWFAGADFWAEAGRDAARRRAIDTARALDKPAEALAIAVAASGSSDSYLEDAARIVEAAEAVPDWWAQEAVGRYYLAAGDYAQAVQWLEAAVARAPAAQWEPYLYLAEVYAAMDDWDAAARAARTALFIDPAFGARANYTLAKQAIAEDDWARAEPLLAKAVPAGAVFQHFAVAVYGPAFGQLTHFYYLPQLRAPGPGETAYAPWLDLAAHYAAVGRPEDAAYIYDVIARSDPYLAEKARAWRAALSLE